MPSTWTSLPTEMQLSVITLLSKHDTRSLSITSRAPHSLCVPALYHDVSIPPAAAPRISPVAHAPHTRRLSINTKTSHRVPVTEALAALLRSCTRLQSLSLSLAAPLCPQTVIPAFSGLISLNNFEIGCWGREEDACLSERLVVALALPLPSLTHLKVSHVSRSALHVDPTTAPFDVPLALHDDDVVLPENPAAVLSLPALLRIPTLKSLEVHDTWLGCDTEFTCDTPLTFDTPLTLPSDTPLRCDTSLVSMPSPQCTSPSLQRLVLTGSMYHQSSSAPSAWLARIEHIDHLELGSPVSLLPATPIDEQAPWRAAFGDYPTASFVDEAEEFADEGSTSNDAPKRRSRSRSRSRSSQPPLPLPLPSITHLHIDAASFPLDALRETMDVLAACGLVSVSVGYTSPVDAPGEAFAFDAKACAKAPVDTSDFATQCALEDLEDWREAIDALLLVSSPASQLRSVQVALAPGVAARWEL
ncbi:hypothetical protein BV22DRAFT_1133654 [Leucogyrophana mollusca]|uniref:Uncharacterized protein n=1 Tax=Leucogyrophana mollusca TaxID=85980 RepID=A0ACB8B1P7_9AGAM|nr:hypothetical protein BV22DRAFT_1133654 [Leucogyrophana mollusca]